MLFRSPIHRASLVQYTYEYINLSLLYDTTCITPLNINFMVLRGVCGCWKDCLDAVSRASRGKALSLSEFPAQYLTSPCFQTNTPSGAVVFLDKKSVSYREILIKKNEP